MNTSSDKPTTADTERNAISSSRFLMIARDACAFSTSAMILLSSVLPSLTVEPIYVALAAQGR